MILGDTIIPWLLGTFLLLALLTLAVTIKSWRELKSSPYFFLRRQAEKRMQTYSLASLSLILASTFTAGYAWQAPADNTPRVAILTNTKPPKDEIVSLFQDVAVESNIETSPPEIVAEPLPQVVAALDLARNFPTQLVTILPEEFDQVDPSAELNSNTEIGQITFSTEIDDNYGAVNPRQIFAEGKYTLYATFDYAEMANGMSWSWVWRHNGSVVDGGNELWNYGDDGPGFIYFNPVEGFQNGEYVLEVWVNGEVLSQSSAIMNNAAISAGN